MCLQFTCDEKYDVIIILSVIILHIAFLRKDNEDWSFNFFYILIFFGFLIFMFYVRVYRTNYGIIIVSIAMRKLVTWVVDNMPSNSIIKKGQDKCQCYRGK